MDKDTKYSDILNQILSQILISSSNVSSASIINPLGLVKFFKIRNNESLLLNPNQIGNIVVLINNFIKAFDNYSIKLGFLHTLYLDFDYFHLLVFPFPDRNLLIVTVDRMENDISMLAEYISKLLYKTELTFKKS